MKKILFIVTKSLNGGAQKWTKEQIEICSDDFSCYLATDENGWLSLNVSVKDSFLNNAIHKRFSLSYFLQLCEFVKNNNIDLIASSSANAGVYSRLLKLFNKEVKVVHVSHGWSSLYNGGKLTFLYTFIEKHLAKISDSILCISKKDFENAKGVIGIDENRLISITNKIFPFSANSTAKKIDNKIKLLSVARLEAPKRVDLLIEATRDLNGIELHIVGDGSQRKYLESMKHKSVVFHGEIDGFDSFNSYDIFCLISDSEGLPLSALEAMSCGLPIVLSNVGGCSELIDNNGVLVNNNVTEIKKAILESIKNQEIFSINSIELFDKMYNLELNKDVYIDYYKSVMND